jgi:hypothetical protein
MMNSANPKFLATKNSLGNRPAKFDPVLRPREDYAATVSRCATFASRDIIAVALRCKIFARASSPICGSASALLASPGKSTNM